MRIFVTGATGFVGSAIVRELITSGHEVVGLARSDTGAETLAAMGADVHPARVRIWKVSATARAKRTDARDSVLAHLAPGLVSTEADRLDPKVPRAASEAAAAAVAARGVRASAVRLPPSTHGIGDRIGFVPQLIRVAREKGVSAHVGDGLNRWPAVHRLDAARLYRLALEKGVEDGPYHAVDDEGVPFKKIAEVIGRRLGVPVVSKTPEEASEHFGWFARFAGMDVPSSSARTRSALGWRPEHAELIADIDQPGYFGG